MLKLCIRKQMIVFKIEHNYDKHFVDDYQTLWRI